MELSFPSGVDLLKNRREGVELGPFDGRVAAYVTVAGVACFVTTNANYVPEIPPELNTILLRKDMRYGTDDHSHWPQKYSHSFCHLGAIPKKPSTSGEKPALQVMWWNPTRADFVCTDSGRTLIRGLGRLSMEQFSRLAQPVNALLDRYTPLTEKKSVPLFPVIVKNLRLGLQRLATLPLTYTQMVLGVTNVQRSYLELAGLIAYMLIYKPRMLASAPLDLPDTPDDCVGVFTSNPIIVQQFHAARLPYWFIRPLQAFQQENILKVVTPISAASCIELEVAAGFPAVQVANGEDEKLRSLDSCTRTAPWYRDLFKEGMSSSELPPDPTPAPGPSSGPQGQNKSPAGPIRGPSRSNKSQSVRASPYPPSKGKNKGSHTPSANKDERDKFILFSGPEMPSSIPSWTRALANVDRSRPVDPRASKAQLYMFPEPALLVASDDERRRQRSLHYYQLIHDALLYRLGDPNQPASVLTTQEWRDVLQGKVAPQGKEGSRAQRRTVTIARILGPAMRACGLDEIRDFPADEVNIPHTTVKRAKEILWMISEMNFRFELLALDSRASGLERPDTCQESLVGGVLFGFDIGLSKQGLAAMASVQRLPYLRRLAKLMCDWRPRPRPPSITEANQRHDQEWTAPLIAGLEQDVANYYTQCFYELFGRAAVIPMRLEHEFGT
ncbi:hypothetical protein B0H11DRAFT_2252155 [Mycena galericulata]|nr:hypothetical protein B0H11DRAFT_2252155 [Mycena galericulata]